MCLMLSKSYNATKRFPSRCFVIRSAALTVPRMFSILSSWFFSFCGSQKYFCLHVFDGASPAAEDQPSCCCSVCPAREPRVPALVTCWPTRRSHSHSVPCCGTLIPRCSVTQLLFCRRPSCQGVLTDAQTSSRCRTPCFRATCCVCDQRVHRSSRCALRSAAGTPTRRVACEVSVVRYVSTRVRSALGCLSSCTAAFLAGECDVRSACCQICQSC